MCEISDQIKLCTCTNKNIEELDDYWILFRLKEPNDYTTIIIGMLPTKYQTNNKIKEINIGLLLKLLNSNSIFDKPVSIIKDDILHIHFHNPNGYSSIEYQFKFTGKAWENIPLDDIAIFMNGIEFSGNVQNGFKLK